MLSPVDKLLAIEAIKILKARYFRFVDSHDWPSFRDVFADDAVFEPPTPPPGSATPGLIYRGAIHGADAFVDYVIKTKKGTTAGHSVHIGYMPEIEIVSADAATGIWGMADIIRSTNRRINGHGYYRESYICRDGKWRISKMALFYKSLEIRDISTTGATVV